jgi:hypothetical protein
MARRCLHDHEKSKWWTSAARLSSTAAQSFSGQVEELTAQV